MSVVKEMCFAFSSSFLMISTSPLYMEGRRVLVISLQLGRSYRGLRAWTRRLKPLSSTTKSGCRSSTIILTTSSSNSLLIWVICVRCCLVGCVNQSGLYCGGFEDLAATPLSLSSLSSAYSSGCLVRRCLIKLEVVLPVYLKVSLHVKQTATSGADSSM